MPISGYLTYFSHLTKPYFSILLITSFESSCKTPGHPGGGICLKKAPINSCVEGRGVEGGVKEGVFVGE